MLWIRRQSLLTPLIARGWVHQRVLVGVGEARRSGGRNRRILQKSSQLGLHMNFQVSQGYTESPIFKSKCLLEVMTLVLGRHSRWMIWIQIFFAEFSHFFLGHLFGQLGRNLAVAMSFVPTGRRQRTKNGSQFCAGDDTKQGSLDPAVKENPGGVCFVRSQPSRL